MATNIGDLVMTIRSDASQFTSGIRDVGDTWNKFNNQLRDSWADVAKDIYSGSMRIKQSLSGSAGAMRNLLQTAGILKGKTEEESVAHQESSKSTTEAALSHGRLAATASRSAAAATAAATAWIGYNLVVKDAVAASAAHMQADSELRNSLGELGQSFMRLKDATAGQFITGVKASLNAVLQLTLGVDSVGGVVDGTASIISSWARSTASWMDATAARAKEAASIFSTALAIWHGADANQAAAFYEEGKSLEQLAQSTEAVIAKQTEQRDSFQFLRKVQEDAIAASERAAEVAKIGSLLTVEAVDAEVIALQQRSAQTILNGQADDAWRKQTEALFVALEKQREGIKNGTIVDKEAEAAKRAAAQQAEEAARKQQQLNDQGIDRIARLKDQIDILNGAATEAEVAMREMARAGFSQEQIQEVGALTEELNRLKEEAKADGKDGDMAAKTRKQREIDTGPAAVLKGSSQALSSIFGATRKTDDRTAKAAETTVMELKKLNNNVLKLNDGQQIVGGGKI